MRIIVKWQKFIIRLITWMKNANNFQIAKVYNRMITWMKNANNCQIAKVYYEDDNVDEECE